MEDIYEFENSEYRLASMQVKAIAYDIIIGITKKKTSLNKQEDKSSLITQLTEINDRIIELADSLEIELEKLDQIEEKIERTSVEQQVSKKENQEDTVTDASHHMEENSKIIENVTSKIIQEEMPIKIEENKKPVEKEAVTTPEKEQTITPISALKIETPEKESQKEDIPKEESPSEPSIIIKEKQEVSPQPINETLEDSSEKESLPALPEEEQQTSTPTKKVFQKTTKNLSKAIMVRANQLENLKKSRQYQEQVLANQGIFEIVEGKEVTKNPINEVAKELPEAIERQIEDLTVKANIYYNEGETEKAQELYDTIKKLNEQYR